MTRAMRQLATAEAAAAVANEKVANGALADAKRNVTRLLYEQPNASYYDVYAKRFQHAEKRVEDLLSGRVSG